MKDRFKNLANYSHIAWDFDGVLVDDKTSREFHEFIKTNPFDQVHSIVTFRSHQLVGQMSGDLSDYGIITLDVFKNIIRLPNAMYVQYEPLLRKQDLSPEINPYLEWKGRQCSLIGADVLIDDMGAMVTMGCNKYNIDYLHPWDV